MRNPFSHSKIDREKLVKLLKAPWLVNTHEDPFCDESIERDEKVYKIF